MDISKMKFTIKFKKWEILYIRPLTTEEISSVKKYELVEDSCQQALHIWTEENRDFLIYLDDFIDESMAIDLSEAYLMVKCRGNDKVLRLIL